MRTLEPGTTAPRASPPVTTMWWLRVVFSTIVAVPIGWIVGTLLRFTLLDVPETDPWEIPAIVLAGLGGGVVAGLTGRVRGRWLAGIALAGAAIGMLTFAFFVWMGLELGVAFGATAWAVCTTGIVASTRFAFGRQSSNVSS